MFAEVIFEVTCGDEQGVLQGRVGICRGRNAEYTVSENPIKSYYGNCSKTLAIPPQ